MPVPVIIPFVTPRFTCRKAFALVCVITVCASPFSGERPSSEPLEWLPAAVAIPAPRPPMPFGGITFDFESEEDCPGTMRLQVERSIRRVEYRSGPVESEVTSVSVIRLEVRRPPRPAAALLDTLHDAPSLDDLLAELLPELYRLTFFTEDLLGLGQADDAPGRFPRQEPVALRAALTL